MKKHFIVLGILLGLSVSSLAFAAPPTENFELGKGEVDIGTSILPSMSTKFIRYGIVQSGDAKHKALGGVTVGLGHNLAFQYRYDENASESKIAAADLAENMSLINQQYNLVYKVNDNINVYAGAMHSVDHVRFSSTGVGGGVSLDESSSKNILQIGANYHKKIAKNTIGWVDAALGNDLRHYEAGIGYNFAKNLDFDLSYQYTKISDFCRETVNPNFVTQGLYAGIQLKF
jgi:opacity protein-like surface antigen